MPNDDRQPQYVLCEACKHAWVGFYFPLPLGKIAALMASLRCPACATGPERIVATDPPPTARWVDPAAAEWPQLTDWIRHGESGISADTIVRHLTGVDPGRGRLEGAPRDPSDLRRCRLLLEAVPAIAAQFQRMRSHSLVWAGLVGAWPDLCAQMDAECPDWRSGRGHCPLTFQRLIEVRVAADLAMA